MQGRRARMKKFIEKAKERGLSPSNVISWLGLETMRTFGLAWGTLRLRVKGALLGVKLGKNIACHGPVGLMRWPGGKIVIGDNVSIISSWRRSTAAALSHPARLRVFGPGAEIIIGEGAQLSGVSITARSTAIDIGPGALLGPDCIIVDSDFHAPWPAWKRAQNPGYENDAPVTVGAFAWIGMRSIILKGTNIGAGAVIGAGSVVTRDIPPNCIAAGNPCRVIRNVPDAGNG